MTRKEQIKSAYKLTGSHASFYDGNAFVRKLKAEGYENVRLIDTTDGTFMG